MIERLKNLINSSDTPKILELMFSNNNRQPELKKGFFHERSLWDFKGDIPGFGREHDLAWARVASHVLGFHNAEGGILIFGINDDDFSFVGASNVCDSARFNNAIRKYIGDLFHVTFSREYIQSNQKYLGIAIIPSKFTRIVSFASDSPKDNATGKPLFSRGDIAVRENDSTRIYRGSDAKSYINSLNLPSVGRGYYIDDENYRILTPDYKQFVYREELCERIMEGIHHPRVAVTSLVGIGGVGKTALATWATIQMHRDRKFDFIVSVTAKDRELTAKSITPLEKPLTSYEELLYTIARVLRLSDILRLQFDEKEILIKEIIKDTNGLIYIDNLETVDDKRIISFLNELPLGVRALVTSRIPRVQVSNYPIDVGTLNNTEVINFIDALSAESRLSYLSEMQDGERLTFGNQCNGIPLVMKWVGARAKNKKEALNYARDINTPNSTTEQLLEFSFRRIFGILDENERSILQVLSIYHRPLTTEAIHIASTIPYQKVGDILSNLQSYSLVEINFDDDSNDNIYGILPITRVFVYGEVKKQTGLEDSMRKRMKDWYDATDIQDPYQRAITRGLRQAQESSEEIMLQLAKVNLKSGDYIGAEKILRETVKKFPRSWEAHRNLAELLKNYTQDTSDAIAFYRKATELITSKDKKAASLVYREYGMLVKNSGTPGGLNESIKSLEHSLKLNSTDPYTIHSLADCYFRIGQYDRAINLLIPIKNHPNIDTRGYVLRLLQKCYEKTDNIIDAAFIKREIEELNQNHQKYE